MAAALASDLNPQAMPDKIADRVETLRAHTRRRTNMERFGKG
jgi:hypothetical protein